MCGMTSKAATSETPALALSPTTPLKTQSVVPNSLRYPPNATNFSAFFLCRPFCDEWKNWAMNMEGRGLKERTLNQRPTIIETIDPFTPLSTDLR